MKDLEEAIPEVARRHGIRPELLDALVWAESNYNPGAISPRGAIGLTQLMPATAAELGVNPKDPMQNLEGGARYLRSLLKQFGSEEMALAAYNWGMGNLRRHGFENAPAETQDYVQKILGTAGPPALGLNRDGASSTAPAPPMVLPNQTLFPTPARGNTPAGPMPGWMPPSPMAVSPWSAPLLMAMRLAMANRKRK